MFSQRGSITVLLGVLILIILVGIGGYYITTLKKINSVSTPVSTPSPSVMNRPSPSLGAVIVDKYSNWRTFENDYFLIKYPPTSYNLSRIKCSGLPGSENFYLTVSSEDIDGGECVRDSEFPVEVFATSESVNEPQPGDDYDLKREDILVAGILGRKYIIEHNTGMGPEWSVKIFLNKNGKTYGFSLNETVNQDKEKLITTFNQMVSTFEFKN